MLAQAFSISMPNERAVAVQEEVAFFEAVKARIVKFAATTSKESGRDYETTIKQIVDQALSSEEVIDIFDAAGIRKPEISILGDEFLQEIKGMKHKNLALELLKRILNDELRTQSKTNLVRSRKLLEMIEGVLKRYQNNLLTTAEVIEELIGIAKDVRSSDERGKALGLNTSEYAFYEALEVNDSAVKVLGDDVLRQIAREVAEKVRANTTIDWTIRESARAKLMVLVRRTLKKYGYPPDKQEKAVQTVLEQAKLMANGVNGNGSI